MNRQSYPRAHRYRSRFLSGGRLLFIGACALIVAILLLVRLVVPGVFTTIASPVWKLGAYVSGKTHAADLTTSKASLLRARDEQAAQIASLTAQNADLAAQVHDLTNLLGTRTSPEKGIVASVLARPPVAPYDVLIIDQGSSAGVTVGASAYGAGGTPIGTVGEVEGGTSRITLYSAHNIKTDGWAGAARIPLSLEGAGAGAFTASVPKDAGIVVGDGVYVSGNGAFPIGTVTKIEQDPSSPTVSLDVRPYTNPFSLMWVTVARK